VDWAGVDSSTSSIRNCTVNATGWLSVRRLRQIRYGPGTFLLEPRCKQLSGPGASSPLIVEMQILDVDEMEQRPHLWVTACQNAVRHLEEFKDALAIMSIDCSLRMIAEREERKV